MAITTKTVTGKIVIPGTTIGIRATVTATPLTEANALTFPADDTISWGPVVTNTNAAGVLTPGLVIPTNPSQTGVLWRISAVPTDKHDGVPASWTLGQFEITGTGTIDLADMTTVAITAIPAAANPTDVAVGGFLDNPASVTTTAFKSRLTTVDADAASAFRVQQDARQAAPKWAAAQAVVVGTVRQAPDGSWIKSTAARTTGATFDATEQTFWTAVAATAGTIEQTALSATYAPAVVISGTGIDRTGVTDSRAAIQAKIDAAPAGGAVYLPVGTYKVVGDLNITTDGAALNGAGYGSHLTFDGGGLVLKGPANSDNLLHPLASGVRVTRTGTAGPAVKISGAATGSGTVRFDLSDITVMASTGVAWHFEGSYIGNVRNCYGFGSTIGLKMTTLNAIGSNAINFFGCEFQSNTKGAELDTLAGVNFFGTCIEGNTAAGLDLLTLCRSVTLIGCYFESNGGYDIQVGNALNPGPGLSIKGGFFTNGTAKTYSIRLIRGESIAIEDAFFVGYGANSPISVAEATAGAVVGYTKNCATNGTGPLVSLGTCTTFRTGGESGERNVTASLLNGWTAASGGVLLSRQGDLVTWQVKNLNGTARTAATFLNIPVGFRPRGLDVTVQPIIDGGVPAWKQLIINGGAVNTLESDSLSAFLYGRGSWLTNDAMPNAASYPGVAYP